MQACKLLFHLVQKCIVHILFGIHGEAHTQQGTLHVTAAYDAKGQFTIRIHANCEGRCMSPYFFSRSH